MISTAVIQSAVSKANSIVNERSEGPETTIEITNVEILGGGLRMPTVQTILSDIFGKVCNSVFSFCLSTFTE